MQDLEGPITAKAEKVRAKFRTLLDLRKLSRNTPALQFNIATEGARQVNVLS